MFFIFFYFRPTLKLKAVLMCMIFIHSVQNSFTYWLDSTDWHSIEPKRRQWILDNTHTLQNKRLGCFCKPKACHGDVLTSIADHIG